MDITFITEYISPIALIICLAVGFIIKYAIDKPKLTKLIPCIVAVLGVIIVAWAEMAFTPSVVAAGLISGLASSGLYEAFKQIININND